MFSWQITNRRSNVPAKMKFDGYEIKALKQGLKVSSKTCGLLWENRPVRKRRLN